MSIIIPVYDDAEGLETTLDSLVDQDYSESYEIIPVDNNSSDDTRKVIARFEE